MKIRIVANGGKAADVRGERFHTYDLYVLPMTHASLNTTPCFSSAIRSVELPRSKPIFIATYLASLAMKNYQRHLTSLHLSKKCSKIIPLEL